MAQRGKYVVNGGNYGNVVQTDSVHGDLHMGAVHYHPHPEPDRRTNGVRALARKDYDSAVADLGEAVRGPDVAPELYFSLALALLRGNRPHRVRSNRDLAAVRAHLRRVEDLPHARLLLLLTDEDRARGWESGGDVPDPVRRLAVAADPARVREILDHVRAPENRVWRILAANQGPAA